MKSTGDEVQNRWGQDPLGAKLPNTYCRVLVDHHTSPGGCRVATALYLVLWYCTVVVTTSKLLVHKNVFGSFTTMLHYLPSTQVLAPGIT